LLKGTAAPRNAASRRRAQAVYAIGIGGMGLVAAAAAFILYVHYSGEIGAYQSAPSCALSTEALQGQACVYRGPAKVLSTDRHDGLEVVVEFDSLPARTFNSSFPSNNEPSSTALSVGITAEGEIWAGKLTRLAGKSTVDNPESHPAQPYLEYAGIFVAGALVILILAGGLARQAWRQK
jgi:hypothetical protein